MLEFARFFPERVLGIAAVDAMFPDAAAAAGPADFAARFEGPGAREAREKMVAAMFTLSTPPQVRKKIETVMLGTAQEAAAGAMRGMADASVWRDDRIDVPFAEIAANRRLTEEGLRKRFRRARLAYVPDAGHFVHMEKPETVNKILIEWLKEQGF